DTGAVETAGGKVVGVFMRQYLGKDKTLTVKGVVKGKELHLTEDDVRPIKPAPWNDQVIGPYRQYKLFADRQVKPGDAFSYQSYEPIVSLVVTNQVKVKEPEVIEVEGKAKRRLLRVEITPEKFENFQLPTLIAWLDDSFQPVRTQFEMPPFGLMVLYRTNKAVALAPGSPAKL